MFGFGKSKKQKLEQKHARLLDEAYKASHSNRKQSDLLTAEAEEVRKEIEALEAAEK